MFACARCSLPPYNSVKPLHKRARKIAGYFDHDDGESWGCLWKIDRALRWRIALKGSGLLPPNSFVRNPEGGRFRFHVIRVKNGLV